MSDPSPSTPAEGVRPDARRAEDGAAGRIDLGGGGLRQRAARGTIVNGLFLVGLYTLGLLRGFVVAAILGTGEYGVWGVVMITFTTILWLKQLGVVDKYVQQDDRDQELAFQRAFTIELLVTGAFVAVMLAAIPLVTLVYGERELAAPSVVFVLAVAISVLHAPLWIFYRRMDFVRQRALQAVEPVLGFVVTVALAVAGAGYWSLVIGFLVGSAGAAVLALWYSPYRPRIRFERGTLREYTSFSWPLFVAAASSLVIAQSSIVVGEHVLGLAGVGIIALASSVTAYVNRVDEVVTQTLYPAICAVRDRVDLLFESFVKSNRLALMWGLPFGVGLALFAGDLVEFGIGERWRPGVVLLQAFGLIAGINHIGFNWDAFYRARGDTKPIAIWSALCMVTFLATAIPLLYAHGLDGLALGMAAMGAVSLGVRMYFLGRLFPGLRVARHMARAFGPTIPAVLVTLGLRLLTGPDRTLEGALGELTVYVLVTVAATAVLERDLLREVLGYLRPSSPGPERESPASSSA
jgi:O-antigen/teichoic acid export membrane protein